MGEINYEKLYNDLMANLNGMHKQNVKKTSTALKSLFIIPTIFLILVFMTKSSKTVFLVLWIASMFIIAAVLIIVEYQDYTLRKMMMPAVQPKPQAPDDESPAAEAEDSAEEAADYEESEAQSAEDEASVAEDEVPAAEEAPEEEEAVTAPDSNA